MKIAVATEEDHVFQHFGKCPTFTIFTVNGDGIQERTTVDASENGHAALTGFLKDQEVDVVICGGIGAGAKDMLSSAGIKLISGIEGKIDETVASYLSGGLSDRDGTCNHEDHGEEHTCNCQNHCN